MYYKQELRVVIFSKEKGIENDVSDLIEKFNEENPNSVFKTEFDLYKDIEKKSELASDMQDEGIDPLILLDEEEL